MQTEMFSKKERKKRSPAQNIYNDFLWYFKKKWESMYRGKTFEVSGKHYGQVKHLLSPVPGFPQISIEEAFRRVDRFIANHHFKVCSHPLNKLIEHWDMFTATIAAENKPNRTIDEQADVELKYTCACGNIVRQKRSVWLQFKGKVLKCKSCQRTMNVNDVLNRIPSIQDYLPTSPVPPSPGRGQTHKGDKEDS